MKFKKILCIMISALMLLSVPVSADGAADVSEEYTLLSEFGFLPASAEKKFNADKKIKRGEFAALASLSMGLAKSGLSAETSKGFEDVTANNENYSDILLCNAAGILNGDGNGNFRPLDKMTCAEGVKVIMSALGYDELAKAYGGYPSGYFVCAAENKITSGVKLDGERALTWGDALKLFANAIDTKVFKQTVFGSEAVYDTYSGETWIEKYHGLKRYSGSFRAEEGMYFENVPSLEKGKIMVDATIFDYDGTRLDLVGRDIYYYAEENENVIAAIAPKNKSERVITVSGDDVSSFKDGSLSYYEGGSEKHVTVSASADTAYNGRPAYLSAADYTNCKGTIKLILNGTKCSAVMVEDPDTFAVKKAIGSKDVFFDMYESRKSFSSKDKEITFTDEYGDTVGIDELGEYDIVSVLQSRDGKYAKLYYSSRETSGTLESVSINGDKITLTVDGNEFKVSKNYADEAKNLSLGSVGLWGINVYGEISAMKPYSTNQKWAYLIETKRDKGLLGELKLRVLGDDGKVRILSCASRVLIDGDSVKEENADKFLPNDGIIRFAETDGKISSIDTLQKGSDENEESLVTLYEGYDSSKTMLEELQYNAYQYIFGSRVPINNNTKIFMVPSAVESDDSLYRVKTRSYYLNDRRYAVNAYAVGADSHIAGAIVMYTGSGAEAIDENVEVTIIDYVSRGISEDGSSCYIIHGLRGGAEVSNMVKDNSLIDNLESIVPSQSGQKHTLSCGDAVKLALNSETQEVTDIELYYDRENDYILKNSGITKDISDSNRMLKASVYSEEGGNLWLTQEDLDRDGVILKAEDVESVNALLYRVYKLELENGKLKAVLGGVSDICDYKNTGENYSKIAMFSKYNNPGVILIYNYK